MSSPDDISDIQQLPVTTRTTGGTTYIVTAEYSKTATENAVDKIRRILLKNAKNILKIK